MKNILIALTLALGLTLLAGAIPSSAAVFNYTDSVIYWPGWANGDDDSTDYIGNPNFLGGTVDYGSFVNSITIDYTLPWSPSRSLIRLGDVFLDFNSDQVWDYVIDVLNPAGGTYGEHRSSPFNIYSLNLPLNSGSGYVLSNAMNWGSRDYRQNHPSAAVTTGLTQVGTATWNGFGSSEFGPHMTEFILSLNQGAEVMSITQLTLGLTTNCANDVVYATAPPVPIPGAVWLLGSGLLGLIGLRRFRR